MPENTDDDDDDIFSGIEWIPNETEDADDLGEPATAHTETEDNAGRQDDEDQPERRRRTQSRGFFSCDNLDKFVGIFACLILTVIGYILCSLQYDLDKVPKFMKLTKLFKELHVFRKGFFSCHNLDKCIVIFVCLILTVIVYISWSLCDDLDKLAKLFQELHVFNKVKRPANYVPLKTLWEAGASPSEGQCRLGNETICPLVPLFYSSFKNCVLLSDDKDFDQSMASCLDETLGTR
ncbi:unnamed protein product [Lymnaea stagnalis]|uniref:Uncharacterized protein n=1 Tax=Lymnaea stagnalis TaxID=6523 RepID=A0AAV2GY80_LYMST